MFHYILTESNVLDYQQLLAAWKNTIKSIVSNTCLRSGIGRNGNHTQKATLERKLPTPLDIMVEDVEVPEDIEIGDRPRINCGLPYKTPTGFKFPHTLHPPDRAIPSL